MNELRSNEHDVFANLEVERGKDRKQDGDAYAKMEIEKALIKERLRKAGGRGAVMELEEDSEEPSEGEEGEEVNQGAIVPVGCSAGRPTEIR